MTKSIEVSIAEIVSERHKFECRSPIKIGAQAETEITIQRAIVTVENRAGKKKASGIGEITLGTAWAWPSRTLTPAQVSRILFALADRVTKRAGEFESVGHPIDFGLRLIDEARIIAKQLGEQMKLSEPIPELGILMACSSIDSAMHDAFGRLHGLSSYDVLSPEYTQSDASKWLGDEFAGKSLDQSLSPKPKVTLPLYHTVGTLDPLSDGELNQRIGDGLPETLGEWIKAEGITHLKIKINGNDLDWDVGRVIEVDRIANASEQSREWRYALDFSEQCPKEDYVLDLIERVDRLSKTVLGRVQYIEQPTNRDLAARKDITMHRVARIKPVVIDESLVNLESLKLARQQGYSGVALKTCRGQTHSLLMGAVAQHYGMFICVQDLVSVGSGFLHSAALAARIQGVTSVEGSGRQYCPAGNAEWDEIYRPIFKIRGGVVPTELLDGPGLGFRWPKKLLAKKHLQLATAK